MHSLEDSTTDYRVEKSLREAENMFLHPINEKNSVAFQETFHRLTKNEMEAPVYLNHQGRELCVQSAVSTHRVARFTFDDLCNKPLGAADYLVFAAAFDCIFVSNIPLFSLQKINQVGIGEILRMSF